MNNYQMLLECYLSGQIMEWAWQEHLKDEVFVAWLRKSGFVLELPIRTPDFSGEI